MNSLWITEWRGRQRITAVSSLLEYRYSQLGLVCASDDGSSWKCLRVESGDNLYKTTYIKEYLDRDNLIRERVATHLFNLYSLIAYIIDSKITI